MMVGISIKSALVSGQGPIFFFYTGIAMKLILCRVCHDTYSLAEHEKRCSCNRTGGRLIDGSGLAKEAEYWGLPGVPLEIDNHSLSIGVNSVMDDMPVLIRGSVLPRDSATFRYRKPPLDATVPTSKKS